jgi:hypothetical protein
VPTGGIWPGRLNNLGIIYKNTHRPGEAEKTYREALTIQRDLAARQPGAYQPRRSPE